MRIKLRILVLRLLLGSLLLQINAQLVPWVIAQEQDPVATWWEQINQARLDEGLVPYKFSARLADAAQRHADDLATHQIGSHTGSDESSPKERIAEAGYAAWKWDGEEPIAGEVLWTGYGTAEEVMAVLLEDPSHWEDVLSSIYREVGIGVAFDAEGRAYYVLDFGARPNVLPVFINDGAISTDNPQVAIRLTNEEARPEGQGAIFMGRAIEIRLSNEPNLEGAQWQPWKPLIPWSLPNTPGEHTVYVQFRDAAGRTAGSADTIIFGEGTFTPPPLVPSSPAPGPLASLTPVSATHATPEPSVTPVIATPQPLSTAMPIPTSPTPDASPSSVEATPFPTWTPLPTATPPAAESKSAPPWTTLVALQGIVIVLGLYLALCRSRDRATSHPTEM